MKQEAARGELAAQTDKNRSIITGHRGDETHSSHQVHTHNTSSHSKSENRKRKNKKKTEIQIIKMTCLFAHAHAQ
jgi:hypothetical protein